LFRMFCYIPATPVALPASRHAVRFLLSIFSAGAKLHVPHRIRQP
jgi:hypothetical protein